MLDFQKMREDFDAYTIDEFEVHQGEIYSSDQDWFREKWFDFYLDLLPKYMIACDDIHMDTQKKITKSGCEYTPNLLMTAQALRRRYIKSSKICKDGVSRSNFLVIDYDKPFGQNDWIDKLPVPQLIIINPVSGKSHILYILDKFYDISSAIFHDIGKYIKKALPDVDRINVTSFRSPFLITGKRKRTESFRKERKEADYHYVIQNEASMYNPLDILEYFHQSLGDLDNLNSFNDEMVVNGSTIYLHTDIGIGSLTEEKEMVRWTEGVQGRNNDLFESLKEFAITKGRSVSLKECNEFAHALNVNGLPNHEVKSIARSVFKFMEMRYKGKKLSAQERSDKGTFAINARWHYFNRTVGETLAEAATKFEVSYATIKRWKDNGKIEFIEKEWKKVVIGSYEPKEFRPDDFPPKPDSSQSEDTKSQEMVSDEDITYTKEGIKEIYDRKLERLSKAGERGKKIYDDIMRRREENKVG